MKFFNDRQSLRARRWSNAELKRLGVAFTGAIGNISGWNDGDKEGGHYRAYFPNATSYSVTNMPGDRGLQGRGEDIEFDLERDVSADMLGRFDVVFSHTVLEHIFDVFTAFHHLCALSRDVVIVVLPFSQVEHWTESYGDYWRFTPQTLRCLFAREGFTLVYDSANDDFNSAIYVLGIGVRDPDKWKGKFPAAHRRRAVGDRIGRAFLFDLAVQLVRSVRRITGRF